MCAIMLMITVNDCLGRWEHFRISCMEPSDVCSKWSRSCPRQRNIACRGRHWEHARNCAPSSERSPISSSFRIFLRAMRTDTSAWCQHSFLSWSESRRQGSVTSSSTWRFVVPGGRSRPHPKKKHREQSRANSPTHRNLWLSRVHSPAGDSSGAGRRII